MALPQFINTEVSDRLLTESTAENLIAERSLPPYEGFNVFDIPVNWADEPRERLLRSMSILENQTGRPLVRSHTAGPVGSFDVQLTLADRAEILEFRSWLQTLRGRQVPMWVPTWHRDLEPTQDIVTTSLVVESVGYSGWLWPHFARRHLAIIEHDMTIYPVGVQPTPTDNGTTESLTLNANNGTFTLGHVMVSFLVLARLQADEVRVSYKGHSHAEVRMRFMEVPREAPVP